VEIQPAEPRNNGDTDSDEKNSSQGSGAIEDRRAVSADNEVSAFG
jgi:hypothetical protein